MYNLVSITFSCANTHHYHYHALDHLALISCLFVPVIFFPSFFCFFKESSLALLSLPAPLAMMVVLL